MPQWSMEAEHPYKQFILECLALLHLPSGKWEEIAKDRNWALLWAWGCDPCEAVVTYLHDSMREYDVIDE